MYATIDQLSHKVRFRSILGRLLYLSYLTAYGNIYLTITILLLTLILLMYYLTLSYTQLTRRLSQFKQKYRDKMHTEERLGDVFAEDFKDVDDDLDGDDEAAVS